MAPSVGRSSQTVPAGSSNSFAVARFAGGDSRHRHPALLSVIKPKRRVTGGYYLQPSICLLELGAVTELFAGLNVFYTLRWKILLDRDLVVVLIVQRCTID